MGTVLLTIAGLLLWVLLGLLIARFMGLVDEAEK